MSAGPGVVPSAFFAFFPFLFIAVWVAASALTGVFSGWNTLQDLYPDRNEEPVLRLRMRSGRLGKGSPFNPWGGVSYNGCLRFDICPNGLRVSVWKIFGLFQRPFFVPWRDIAVEKRKVLLWTFYTLNLGWRSGVALTVNRQTFSRIADASPLAGPGNLRQERG